MPKKIIDEFSNLPQKYRWRKRHPEKWKVNNDKADKKWRESDKGRLSKKKTALKIHRKLRLKVITLLGGKCSNPFNIDHSSFEKEPDYINSLQVDHINGGGVKERKKLGSNGMYYKVLKNSEGYQLLCANCNWIKRWKNKEFNQYH